MSFRYGIRLGVLCMLVSPLCARAACNQIPSAEAFRAKAMVSGPATPPDAVLKVAERLERLSRGGELSFKGGLGRASRSLIFPHETAGIAVSPDFTCVNGKGAMPGALPESKDDVVAVIFYPTKKGGAESTPVYARLFAATPLCEEVKKFLKNTGTAENREFAEGVRMLTDCSNEDVRFELIDLQDDRQTYVLKLPVKPVSAAQDLLLSPNVRISVFRASTLAHLQMQLPVLADPNQECAHLCTDPEISATLDVCMDKVYETFLHPVTLAPSLFVVDPVACNIAIPSGITCGENDYQKLCASPDLTNLAKCTNADSEIKFWRSNCGGIHFPFSWAGIRKDPDGRTAAIDRVLSGRSAAGHKHKAAGSGKRVYLPGREFVGSTACVQQCNNPPCTNAGNWRLPEVDVWDPYNPSMDAGLTGVVDKQDSVIHIFPILKAALQCEVPNDPNAQEACTGIEHYQGKQQTVCACTDRYAGGCICKPALQSQDARFFACAAPPNSTNPNQYEYAGLPCTRHNHCPYGGYCSASPKCRPEGTSVWGDGGPAGGNDCQSDSDCSAGQACGYRLFDFSPPRVDSTTQVGTLHRQVKGSGNTLNRRGSCSNNPSNECNKKAACQNTDCYGYDLVAGGKAP